MLAGVAGIGFIMSILLVINDRSLKLANLKSGDKNLGGELLEKDRGVSMKKDDISDSETRMSDDKMQDIEMIVEMIEKNEKIQAK